MALELLFTSAVQGLKSGSQGYCTVQCTQAMPGPLAERLEALSAYRPIYPSQSEQAKLNPVNVAYWRIRAVGKTFPVLSRIADYGLDYSQRTNKLAHHLVLEPSELSVAGPAAIAASGSAFVTQWNQKVESIQQPRRLPVAATTVGVCRHWQTVMGDAGWAGVVAEEIIKDQKQPIFLIFEPGQEVLPLIVEVQSLLPAALRWKSTFSTYLTYLPPEAECQIRCLLKGSKEAHESLRHVNSLRIDLTQPTPTQASPLVDAARTGVMPVPVKKPEAGTAFDYEIDEAPSALPSHRGVAVEPLKLQVDESGRRPGLRGRRKQYNAAPVLPQKRGIGLYIAGGVSVLVLSLVGGVVAMQILKPRKEKPKESVENVVQTPVAVFSEPMASVVSAPEASNLVEAAPVVHDSPKSDESTKGAGGTMPPSVESAGEKSPLMSSNEASSNGLESNSTASNKTVDSESVPSVIYLTDLNALSVLNDFNSSGVTLKAEEILHPRSLRLIYPEELVSENNLLEISNNGDILSSRINILDDKKKIVSGAPLFDLSIADDGVHFAWKKSFNPAYNAPAILSFSIVEIDPEQLIYLSLHKKRKLLLSASTGNNPRVNAYWLEKVNPGIIPAGSSWTAISHREVFAKDMVVTLNGDHNKTVSVSLKKKEPEEGHSKEKDYLEFLFQSDVPILVEAVSTTKYSSTEKPYEQLESFTSEPLIPINFTVKIWLDRVELDFKYDHIRKQIEKIEAFLEKANKSLAQESDAFRDAKRAAKETVSEYLAKLKTLNDVPVSITGRIEYSLEDVERKTMIPVTLVEFVKEPQ